ncbi:metal-dependent hydrolase [Marinobacter nauticus]|jgi:inner membrane protein|uniref:Membrane-bound metal-dependent hydrolase n=1 Tax=Marinobacter nauticus (strain ATCC 700491 / DSM 11845 / VT8) TaxID=351348 RepID=A1U6Q1_MARN8|nr:metal-dependent hydrolase [Marinobacter nauticus]ABM20670.1 membrane-bound metal-dependent hydrolase [Marinobacter nauticus VT8]MBY5960415.1 metal-dependent hydrolase [Marinobacter nauticus]MEC9040149.1 metal-dependent hydrolase [Pseudomonadota bacterium]MEC9083969.1 metal-dependent hydrolase [Pseudomonadota bacterium]
MDSITQAALGASIAGAVAGKTLGRSALLTGALLGTLPDLDVVIDYGTAVANFTQHRGFSHSLFILAPLSLLIAWGLWRWKPLISYQRWLALVGLILITHPLLDAFTTYGTQLFWPIGPPVAINSIFIIDPLYTLPLLAGCLAFLYRPPASRTVAAGLLVSSLYLGWTLIAQQIITDRVRPALANAGMEQAALMVQPMPFNTVLWRATAVSAGQRIEVVTGFLDASDELVLERFPRQPELARLVAELPEARRLEWFTGGFLDYQQNGTQITATDIRLGIPGAHPFTFILAETAEDGLQPLASDRLPRPALNRAALPLLWDRMTGQVPVLCLATLSVPNHGNSC